MSSVLSGRLVQPCSECGTLLRLSAMTLVASAGAIGLLITSVSLFLNYSRLLLIVALLLTVVILIGVMGTRVETAPVADRKEI
jgi:CHASE2 domain-containing sensor protein